MNFENLIKYYQSELSFLVESGKDFCEQYPNLAKTLDFSSFGSDDPHVQRIIESVAFLNAKLQQRLDEQSPEISEEILHSIYPQFVTPIPSCTIMQFSANPTMLKSIVGKIVPRGTLLHSNKTYEDQHYTFQTSMDIQIAPYIIQELIITHTNTFTLPYEISNTCENVLVIKLEKIPTEIISNKIKFYIHMPEHLANKMYEAIFGVFTDRKTPVFDGEKEIGVINEVGFSEEEQLFPTSARVDVSYHNLLEYNAFYKKFMFFEVELNQIFEDTLIIPLKTKENLEIRENSLQLNCTPAVNLFTKTSEPIELNNKSNDYRIVPDYRTQENLEIHTLLKIEDTDSDTNRIFTPYFSCKHVLDNEKDYVFWVAKRTDSKYSQYGSDLFVSFKSNNLFETSIYARLICLQRNANRLIPANEEWSIEESPGGISCNNLERPTPWHMPPLKSEAQWRLISHLAINYFGFNNANGTGYIKELLKIYDFKKHTNKNTLSTILNLDYEIKMVSFNRNIVPKAFITLEVDDTKPTQIFLLSTVLGHFFANNLDFNTKLEFNLKRNSNDEIWKKWNLI